MYSMKTGHYTCDFCDFEMEWDGHDDIHGEMWGCEKCGDTFCSKCFINKHGHDAYVDMMQGADCIMCPTCFGKRKEETQ